jgi:hypothetical protein
MDGGCKASTRLAKLRRVHNPEAEAIMIKLGKLGVAMLLCMLVLAGCNTDRRCRQGRAEGRREGRGSRTK